VTEEKITLRLLNEQFGESRGNGGYTGCGFQSSECPWMKVCREEGGPEPSCLDIDWDSENKLEQADYTVLRDGGLCPSCRGFGHDERGLLVRCAAE